MSFTSVSFIVFIAAVFLIYWGIPHKFRYILLICANLIFYGSFGAEYVPVLIGEAVCAYIFGLLLKNKRKPLLAAGIVITVAALLVFKYLNFTIYTVDKVLGIISAPVSDHTLKLIAPIGLSFYTFESLSYIIDVYKGKTEPEKNFLKLFAFMSYFPTITSGPIKRYGDFKPELESEKSFDYEKCVYGMRLILLGMVKKLCGANVLKQYTDAVFNNVYAYRGPVFIVAIIFYTYEIYLDFSGYTDMARGLSYMLGMEVPENFKAPYLSVGVKQFFARWHISLSQWLRDYVYIPLGGSRCSKARKYFNLIVTFLVSGLWHGAGFTFIVWGMLHGIYQCVADAFMSVKYFTVKADGGDAASNRKLNNAIDSSSNIAGKDDIPTEKIAWKYKLPDSVRIIVTFGLVSFAWMFFRANSLTDAKYIMINMFTPGNFYGQLLQMGLLSTGAYIGAVLIIVMTVIYDVYSEKCDVVASVGRLDTWKRWVLYIAAGVLVTVMRSHVGAAADFIYFKF